MIAWSIAQALYVFAPLLVSAALSAIVVASFLLALVLHPLIALVGYLVGARRSAR